MIKKVLFITNVYPNEREPFRGVYVQNRAKQLLANGFDVRVAFLSKQSEKVTDIFCNNYSYQHQRSRLNYFGLGPKPIISKDFYFDTKDFCPDLIIFCVTSLWLKKLIIKKMPSFKFANFFEGRNGDGQYKDHKMYKFFIKRHEIKLFKKMSFLLFCSPLAQNDFLQKFKMIDRKKCHTLLNGFDSDVFVPATSHFFDSSCIRILTVGNLEPTKGIKLLSQGVDIFAKSTNKKIYFEIIGTGSRANIEEIKNCITQKNVILTHKLMLSQKELKDEMMRFDFFVLPSYFESFGCVYLEAMSQGLIAVGCENQGPSLYIKDMFNGFLLKEKSIEDIIRLLNIISSENFDSKIISKNSILTSKEYGWDRFGKEFKKLFS